MAEKISNDKVKALKAPETGNRITYDTKVSGFGVRVTAAGAKSFILNYRIAGRERRYTIGTYGPSWSVEKARKRAGELRRMVDAGKDPLAERVDAREAPTVNDLCDRFEADFIPRKRASTQTDYKSFLANVIRPKLGNRKVADVRRADVDKMHNELKGTPTRANRAAALASVLFSYAMRLDWRADNPCRGVDRFPEEKRTRFLNAAEIVRLTKALADYEDQKAANLVRLCLLTGCRRGEALAATWAQFDLKTGVWVKPSAHTKQKKEHRIPLSGAALALLNKILASADRDEDGEVASVYLFPGRWASAPLSEIKDEWQAIREAAGIPDVRLHDLRHTYASILASAGQSLPIIGALLGHTQAQTTQRYAHLLDDPLRKATETVGNVVTGTKGADVVTHPKSGAA